jgi:hypothetical protein
MVKGYTVLIVPIVLKKAGIVKGEGCHRKYTEEMLVEELRGSRFQPAGEGVNYRTFELLPRRASAVLSAAA